MARLSGSCSAAWPSPERSTATEIVLAAYSGSSRLALRSLQLRQVVGEGDDGVALLGLDPGPAEHPQQVVVLVLEPEDPDLAAGRGGGQGHARLARVVADGVAVGAGPGLADHVEHAGLQRRGDAHLEGLGLLVDLVPGHAHHLDQERLDQPVAADHVPGHLEALGGEDDPLARAAVDQALALEPADHPGDAGRRHLHGPGQVGRRPLDAGLPEPVERLQVLLDRGGEGGAVGHDPMVRGAAVRVSRSPPRGRPCRRGGRRCSGSRRPVRTGG